MLYNDYTITISAQQGAGYPVSALAEGMGRNSDMLAMPPAELLRLITEVDRLPPGDGYGDTLTAAGVALFHWLTGRLETHLRVAWDRAEHNGRGLRLRLGIDPPERCVRWGVPLGMLRGRGYLRARSLYRRTAARNA